MKLNVTNTEKLNAAIAEAEGRATVRRVTAKDIIDTLSAIQVPKAHLNGTKVYWYGAETFPQKYKYTPQSTHWTAENVSGRWYVTDIHRDTCPNRCTRRGEIEFSEDAKTWIVNHASIIN